MIKDKDLLLLPQPRNIDTSHEASCPLHLQSEMVDHLGEFFLLSSLTGSIRTVSGLW